MTENNDIKFIWRFAYRHFETDGKLENLIEALDEIDADRAALTLYDPAYDGYILDRETGAKYIDRIRVVIRKLKKYDIHADVILPSLSNLNINETETKTCAAAIYAFAADLPCSTFWIDDTLRNSSATHTGQELRKWYGLLRQYVHQKNPGIKLGLIAASPRYYMPLNLSAADLALILANDHAPILLQYQPYPQDDRRTDILHIPQTISFIHALNHRHTDMSVGGYIPHTSFSPFDKSAESEQIQILFNLMYGSKRMMIDCFDRTGSAPGTENLYLRLVSGRMKFLRKIADLYHNPASLPCVRIVIPEKEMEDKTARHTANAMTDWTNWIWRLGMPAAFIHTSQVTPADPTHAVYILTGDTPKSLSRSKLNHVFRNGALLDSNAALALQDMGLTGFTGLRVKSAVKKVVSEVLLDQSFAAPYYGHRTDLTIYDNLYAFRDLMPFHPDARHITMLIQNDRPPRTNGIMVYDNTESHQRCAVLPYSLKNASMMPFLNIPRQRHFRDLIHWLLRRRLECFVENTPDLIPFLHLTPALNRAVLLLFNISYDWAVDSRIRLGQLPFTIKRVRELNEQGDITTLTDCLVHHDGYHFLQLNPDTAVPPFQTAVLILDG